MKMMPKTENLLDKLADEIAELATNSEKIERVMKILEEQDAIEKRNSNDIINLKEKISILEGKLNKFLEDFKISVVEAEREITERHEKILNDMDKQIVRLQSQIEDLRTAIIRISNEVKNLKERL
ncbi:MAG: hypothetical protein QXQ18_00370 [Candidatus Aenigmatarchaeota archaeon]